MLNKIFALTFVIGLLLVPVSHATSLTYSYRGPDFDTPSPLPSPYEAGDHVEGFITIDDSFLDASGSGLLETFDELQPWLLGISFTDGVQTLSNTQTVVWGVALAIREFEPIAWNVFFSTRAAIPAVGDIESVCGDPWYALINDEYTCDGQLTLEEELLFDVSKIVISGDEPRVTVRYDGVGVRIWESQPSGDLDDDGDVDMDDLNIVASCFGQMVDANPACEFADVAPPPDGDGVINILDVSFVVNNFTEI